MKSVYQSVSSWLGGKRGSEPLPALGSREVDVLKILWRHGELSAQEVLRFFISEQLSLSTMQSTLERLHRKNLLHRHKTGRAYLYSAAISQSAIVSRLMEEIAQHLGNGESSVMISGFMSYIENQEDKTASSAFKTMFENIDATSI